MRVEGQWIGVTDGDTVGRLIIDIDDCFSHFEGVARLLAKGEPGIVCPIVTPDRSNSCKLQAIPLAWLEEGQTVLLGRDTIAAKYPDISFPQGADVEMERQGDTLKVSWESSVGMKGTAVLKRSDGGSPSELEPISTVKTWDSFKEFALGQSPGKYVFRGQPEAFKLRTAFHRSHRKDLVRYTMKDIPSAHRLLTARTRHVFDLSRPDEQGAFWNLLQHHGYPTPLLDWTYSPFVAAFFAYRRRQGADSPSDMVRIFAFDKHQWESDFNQIQAINFADIHFSFLEALAIENPRAIPQQALSTLANTDDIESYIRLRESEKGKTYLYAIDLPASFRREIMIELSFMGITAGSLFPGLDGACEELRGRMFHQQ